jgi:hypothetical protein
MPRAIELIVLPVQLDAAAFQRLEDSFATRLLPPFLSADPANEPADSQ